MFLDKLKSLGKKIVLISNADVMERKAWKKSPLNQYFDYTFFSCDVGYAKPDPEIFELCLKTIGESADKCIFVGDGGSNELLASRNAGIQSVFFSGIMKDSIPHEIENRKKQADYHIDCLTELIFEN